MIDPLSALLFPFLKGLLPPPQLGRGFFLRAEAGAGLDEGWRHALICEQSFKPAHDQLQNLGFKVERALTGDGYDVGLCLLTKHKAESLANVGRAWAALRPGGTLVCAGGKDVGAASVEKALQAAGVVVSSLSKHHCKVFWAERGEEIPAQLAAWAEAGRQQMVPEIGCLSQPGLYNWNKVDAGSALLVEHLPADLHGRVADLGAGWGYLSAQLLDRKPQGPKPGIITALDLYEAEGRALDAAQANLARFGTAIPIGYHWHDVAAGIPKAAYHAVVMNPPFHEGKATDIELGKSFITAAAQALVPKGRLIMVANRHLPYEPVLKEKTRRFEMVAEDARYKVFVAQV
jgi:16S rRNA (guanine1207-N2)-methyltransferase